jgi:Tol biopolymer transport system component
MWVRKITYLALLIFLTACAQTKPINVPTGISLLKGIDPRGLQYPIWSPDGTRIVVSYIIEPMGDIFNFFPPEPRHDIYIIDTENWVAHLFLHADWGLMTEAWSRDSKSFAMSFNGAKGNGIYAFNLGDYRTVYLSKDGTLSPDWEEIAESDDRHLSITDVYSRNVMNFKVPTKGTWYISTWSPDMNQLTLVHRNHEEDRYDDVYLFDVNSGGFSQFTKDNSYFKFSPAISPNGQLIAYVIYSYSVKSKIIISRLDQSCEWSVPLDNVDYFTWSPDSQRLFILGWNGAYMADLKTLFGSGFINENHCP